MVFVDPDWRVSPPAKWMLLPASPVAVSVAAVPDPWANVRPPRPTWVKFVFAPVSIVELAVRVTLFPSAMLSSVWVGAPVAAPMTANVPDVAPVSELANWPA